MFGPGGGWRLLAGRPCRAQAADKIQYTAVLKACAVSTNHALEDSVASLPANFSAAYVDTLSDVDSADDLQKIRPFSYAR